MNLVSCFLVRKNATIKETRRKIIVSIGDDDVSDKNIKDNILEATIQAFQKKGLKFTMDDITSLLGISKKTIYTVFPDKNSLVLEMVDYCFYSIKESEQKVLQGPIRLMAVEILKYVTSYLFF